MIPTQDSPSFTSLAHASLDCIGIESSDPCHPDASPAGRAKREEERNLWYEMQITRSRSNVAFLWLLLTSGKTLVCPRMIVLLDQNSEA